MWIGLELIIKIFVLVRQRGIEWRFWKLAFDEFKIINESIQEIRTKISINVIPLPILLVSFWVINQVTYHPISKLPVPYQESYQKEFGSY